MSSVHPPASAPGVSAGTPCGYENDVPGAGQVLAVAEMNCSMLKGWLVKCVFNVVVLEQSGDSGGDVRLTSFCSKQP